jgi:hypothetical protein
MMNRRWFFTASGSAYLAACCSFVGKNKKAAPDFSALNLVRPAAPDAQFTQVVDRFFIGLDDQLAKMLAMSTSVISDAQLPRDPAKRDALFRQALTDIYRKRFDYRLANGELSDLVYFLLVEQSCAMGQLTGLAFAYETGALGDPAKFSFEKPDTTPVLGTKHLEWARDTYGLYTNSNITARRMIKVCGELGGPVQIDDPCPLCYA